MKLMEKMRTDLALELFDGCPGAVSSETRVFESSCGKINVEEIVIETKEASKRLGKPCGKYVTVTAPRKIHELSVQDSFIMSDIIARELKKLVSNCENTTVVGLGNRNMTVDSLGVKTAEKITPTRIPEKSGQGISAIIPGVMMSTGISAIELLIPLLSSIETTLAVIVDSLASKDIERLGRTVQISDAGIVPGSGLGLRTHTLNKNNLMCDVISIGVPTVIAADDIVRSVTNHYNDDSLRGLILGAVDSDIMTEAASSVIALAIEKAYSV